MVVGGFARSRYGYPYRGGGIGAACKMLIVVKKAKERKEFGVPEERNRAKMLKKKKIPKPDT